MKNNTHTHTSGPEPGPGPELRCVALEMIFALIDQNSSMLEICLCVYVSGGLGKPEPSNVSLHSNSSIHRLMDFRNGHHHEDQ